MNKIFKVMWNAKKGCNVVTSEKAKGTCRFQESRVIGQKVCVTNPNKLENL